MAGRHGGWQRYAAPTAFLAVATVAILIVASALRESKPAHDRSSKPAATAPSARAQPATNAKITTTRSGRRYYTVVAGDTFGVIAAKTGTTVARLEQLNPGVSSTSLHIGQKLRVA